VAHRAAQRVAREFARKCLQDEGVDMSALDGACAVRVGFYAHWRACIACDTSRHSSVATPAGAALVSPRRTRRARTQHAVDAGR
jgi:hypothetical protein